MTQKLGIGATKKIMVTFIIPAHNEESTIFNTICALKEKMLSHLGGYEIIVVNDGSSDDTALELRKRNLIGVTYYDKACCQGKGSAIKTGFKMVKSDSEYVIFMDADMQIDIYDIDIFFKIMDFYNADAVVGNKVHQYSNSEYTFLRRQVSNIYSLIIKILFNLKLKDTQCGLKLFRKKALDKIMPRILAKQYAFDLEVLVAMRENGIRVADAPVHVKRSQDKGSLSIGSTISTLIDTLAVKYRQMKGHYRI